MAHRRPFPFALLSALVIASAGCAPDGDSVSMQEDAPPMPRETAPTGVVAAAPARSQERPPLDTRSLQAAQIVDRDGFGQPMVAAELQIPTGWTSVGGITWNDQTPCVGNQLQFGWTALGPDSLTAIEKLPGFTWQVSGTETQFNPCPSAPFRSAREFLEATALKLRPGGRVLDYQDLTEEALRSMPASSAASSQTRWDVGRLLVAYEDRGIDMRETLTAAVSFSQMQGSLMGGTAVIDVQRAPDGRLDLELGRRVAATVRGNPQWQEAMRQRQIASMNQYHGRISSSIRDWHEREMAAINARGAADRQAIRMRTQHEVAGIYGAIAANTSATNERIHARTVDAIQGVDSYAGKDGGVVKSSIHGGARVFQNDAFPQRAYSTDDPYHAPADATELERIP